MRSHSASRSLSTDARSGPSHVLAGAFEGLICLFEQAPQAVDPQGMVLFEEVGFLVRASIVEVVLHDAIEFGPIDVASDVM